MKKHLATLLLVLGTQTVLAGGNTPDNTVCQDPIAVGVKGTTASFIDPGYVVLLEGTSQNCEDKTFGRKWTVYNANIVLGKKEGHMLDAEIVTEYISASGKTSKNAKKVNLPLNVVRIASPQVAGASLNPLVKSENFNILIQVDGATVAELNHKK